jgi:hypothetical protein
MYKLHKQTLNIRIKLILNKGEITMTFSIRWESHVSNEEFLFASRSYLLVNTNL